MKILLINPPRLYYKDSVILRSSPPLGLSYIAGSLIRAGYIVDVLDAIAEAPFQISDFSHNLTQHGLTNDEIVNSINGDYSMIGISCMFTDNWLTNRVLIDSLKQKFPDTKIVIGGEHASASAEMCLEQAKGLDAVVLGEGEETIVAIVDAYEQGKSLSEVTGVYFRNSGQIFATGARERIRNLNNIPWPAWELFPLDTYFEYSFSYGVDYGNSLPVMATRGCPYQCTFCSSPQMWGTKYSMRSPEDLFSEIKFLYHTHGVTNFDFYDLTAIIKKQWIIEFAKLVITTGLTITWQIPAGTRSEAIDDEVAMYLFQSGCKNITYAPESGSQRVLDEIKKKVTPDKMLQSIKSSYNAGLNIKLNIIMGFPNETHSDILKTIWFMVRATWHGAHDAVPAIFSPYPGSALFDQLRKENVIKGYDDAYFINIVKGATYFSNPVYNQKIHKNWVRFYTIFGTIFFYMCNYLFRPQRLYTTIKNMITQKYESRFEISLAEILKRVFVFKKGSNQSLQKNILISR